MKHDMEKNRKLLLASAAMALAIGCTAAVAQVGSKEGTGAGTSRSQGSAQHQLSPGGANGAGGAMQHGQATPGAGEVQNQTIPEKQGMGPPKGTSQNNEERHGSTRQRGAEENNEPQMQRGAEENNRTQMQRGAEENSRTNTQRGAEENERGGLTGENRENNARSQEPGSHTGNTTVQNKGANAKSVQLSESQRTQIKNIVVKDRNVAHVSSPNFRIAVGSAVPHNVHVAVLPPDVVRVVPEYRGFDYIVVSDQLLIIDPETMEIVTILPA
ncbi:MAG TPA: DUF1236 domain-containing protein [Xanthobacteraceae bacterium]|jgi:hypothetical protein